MGPEDVGREGISWGWGGERIAGTVVCRGRSVEDGGSVWQETAAVFPKGSGGMDKGESKGSRMGGGMMGGWDALTKPFSCAGTKEKGSAEVGTARAGTVFC